MNIVRDMLICSSEQGVDVDSSPHELWPPQLSMANIVNKIDSESNNDSESGSQQVEIFERPTGLKGLYYHPATQVSAALRSYYSDDRECL